MRELLKDVAGLAMTVVAVIGIGLIYGAFWAVPIAVVVIILRLLGVHL